MIFRPELAAKVLDGTKTVTRRRAEWPDGCDLSKPLEERTEPLVPCRYVMGRSYAVQDKRGGRALARVVVTDVRLVVLGAMDDEDARREGFEGAAAFLTYWRRLYRAIDPDERVWRVAFELVSEGASR